MSRTPNDTREALQTDITELQEQVMHLSSAFEQMRIVMEAQGKLIRYLVGKQEAQETPHA